MGTECTRCCHDDTVYRAWKGEGLVVGHVFTCQQTV